MRDNIPSSQAIRRESDGPPESTTGDCDPAPAGSKPYRGPERRSTRASRSHLTVREVAARWGVSANFVRRLLWDGKLAGTRFGRAVRIPMEAVEDFALRNTNGAGSFPCRPEK